MISRNNEIKRCLHEITSCFFFQFFVRISKNLVGQIYYFIITTYKVFPKIQFFVRESYFLVFTISNILIFTPYCTTHYLICASQFMCLYTTYNLAITTYYLICAPYHFVCTKTICRLARNNFNITHCMSENLEATQRSDVNCIYMDIIKAEQRISQINKCVLLCGNGTAERGSRGSR